MVGWVCVTISPPLLRQVLIKRVLQSCLEAGLLAVQQSNNIIAVAPQRNPLVSFSTSGGPEADSHASVPLQQVNGSVLILITCIFKKIE